MFGLDFTIMSQCGRGSCVQGERRLLRLLRLVASENNGYYYLLEIEFLLSEWMDF